MWFMSNKSQIELEAYLIILLPILILILCLLLLTYRAPGQRTYKRSYVRLYVLPNLYVCLYVLQNSCALVCALVFAPLHLCTHMCTCMCSQTCICACICICMCSKIHMCSFMCMKKMFSWTAVPIRLKGRLPLEKDFAVPLNLGAVTFLSNGGECIAPPGVIPELLPSQGGWFLWFRIEWWYRSPQRCRH